MSQLFAFGWPKYWSFSFIIPSMNTQDWSPLGWTGWISLQSKGLSSLLQHHNSKVSILQHSTFFTVQLSHLYMTTGKTIALTRQVLDISYVKKGTLILRNQVSSRTIQEPCQVVSRQWIICPSQTTNTSYLDFKLTTDTSCLPSL